MSVKDKIAMWNSMAVNPNPPQPNPAKLTVSDPHPKPKQQEKEKIVPKNLPSNLTQEPVHPPSLTFNFKKTQSTEQPPQNIPHHISQPSNLPQKGCEIVKPSEAKKQEKEANNAPKFSDIKKQLETQTAGKGIYFTAPVAPPKKIEEQPANKATECEIQKDIPRFSVKEQAAKLAQFYQQKHMNQLKKNQQKQQAQVLHQHEKEPLPQSIHKEEPNTLNIVNQNMNSPPDHPKQKEQKQLPKPNITDHPSDPIDTTLRGKNKNKMKKQAFDDED